jgi:hypothetical protein
MPTRGRPPRRFRDVPEPTAFKLPDTSHIDGTDVPKFTISLANLLKKRGLAQQ